MNAVSLARLVTTSAVAPLAVIAGAGLAHADPPSPGDPCSVWHATTQDGNGKTMWCNHTMTGTHSLVWQYGGPSDIGGPAPLPQGTDAQGFLGYPGARCDYVNPAVIMGRTPESLVVICKTGAGRFYYKGFGLQNGLSVEIDDPTPTSGGFVATNNGVQYTVSPTALVVTQGSAVLSSEPMLEYWTV